MIAKERGLKARGVLSSLTLLGLFGSTCHAQLAPQGASRGASAKGRTAIAVPAAPKTPAQQEYDPTRPGQLQLTKTAIPVNPSDPIAVINGEIISRQQLADECVARKGEEILETLVARTLIGQALRSRGLEVTAQEIDVEIDSVARHVAGIDRQAWLRTLDKERGISPIQYARDIIYPALALRKLAAPRVQVTPQDVQNAFEAQYGDKLRCRMIMVDKIQTAKEIWEEIKKNPAGFEKLAMDRSMDSGSRSLGGLLAEPISRHAYPRNVSERAFEQLVDGDPKDTDKSHKPKDGDFTGPIQVAEATWVIIQRDRVIPAQKVDANDPEVKKATFDMIYEVKLKEAMGEYMVDLMQKARIDNKLTGRVKEANEQIDYDKQVELSGNHSPAQAGSSPTGSPGAGTAPRQKTPTPAALSPDVAKQAERLTAPSSKK